MELFFLHADNNKNISDMWRQAVYNLATKKDLTYKLYAIRHRNGCENIPAEDMKMISLAFIYIDLPGSFEIGLEIYKANPFCRIVYYGNEKKDIIPFLSSRPVTYVNVSESDFDVYKCIEKEYEKLIHQTGMYRYKDRFQNMLIPYSSILYFNIKNRFVYCQTESGEKGPIRQSLDLVESEVQEGWFIRCHKSYLLFKDACVSFDKTRKEIVLSNGFRIKVSRPYWKDIIDFFC